jgi:REP element-mobilizing transposase RayT
MKKMVGYMLTWTTYGSWLQGDERGYVKNGKVLAVNVGLRQANMLAQKAKTVKLNQKGQKIVRSAILSEAENLDQKIYAIAVHSNHVHIVLNPIARPISKILSHYKNATRLALEANGFVGKLWTKGYDKRYCFNEDELKSKIDYVRKHNQNC